MRRKAGIAKILRVQEVRGFEVVCLFNNGEKRLIDFSHLFDLWNVSEPDPEYGLKKPEAFNQLKLENGTLSWSNIPVHLKNEGGGYSQYPYEPSPETLYSHSKLLQEDPELPGSRIREMRKTMGLSQQELAERSGTTKNYISRIERNRSDIEWLTLRKIVEAGFGKRLIMKFE